MYIGIKVDRSTYMFHHFNVTKGQAVKLRPIVIKVVWPIYIHRMYVCTGLVYIIVDWSLSYCNIAMFPNNVFAYALCSSLNVNVAFIHLFGLYWISLAHAIFMPFLQFHCSVCKMPSHWQYIQLLNQVRSV
jgi:hypothetical protein